MWFPSTSHLGGLRVKIIEFYHLPLMRPLDSQEITFFHLTFLNIFFHNTWKVLFGLAINMLDGKWIVKISWWLDVLTLNCRNIFFTKNYLDGSELVLVLIEVKQPCYTLNYSKTDIPRDGPLDVIQNPSINKSSLTIKFKINVNHTNSLFFFFLNTTSLPLFAFIGSQYLITDVKFD